jgi:hypothetical protein
VTHPAKLAGVLRTAIGPTSLVGVLRTAHWLYTAPRQFGGGNEPYAVAGRSTRAQHLALVSLAGAGRRRTGHPRPQEAQETVLQDGRHIVVAQGAGRPDGGAVGIERSAAVLTGTQVLLEGSQGLGRQGLRNVLDKERRDLLAC